MRGAGVALVMMIPTPADESLLIALTRSSDEERTPMCHAFDLGRVQVVFSTHTSTAPDSPVTKPSFPWIYGT